MRARGVRLLAVGGVVAAALVPALSRPAVADVSPTTLPPSAPDRLAYSTAIYTSDASGQGMAVHGLGTIGTDGTDQRTLTDPPTGDGSFDHTPQWSPDGTWLAYLQDRPDPNGNGLVDRVAVIPRDGGDPQIIDSNGYGPAWSPDGLHLAWVSVASDGTYGIAVADVVTTPTTITLTNRRTLTLPDPTKGLGWPTFSPDGLKLAFAVGDYYSNQAQLYTMTTAGTDLTQITHHVAIEVGNGNYAFSPDGTKLLTLAETSANPGAPQAFVVNSDGTDQHQVFPNTANLYEDAAVWTPTGDAIALVTNSPYQGIKIFGLDGKFRGALAENRFSSWGGLVYSPDGNRIYSVADPGKPGDQGPWAPDLYAIPVNGDAPQRLTTDHSVFPTTVQAIDPGKVLREFGDGEIDTAAAAVTDNVHRAGTVVITDAADYASSLAASPLAAKLHAPVLLTGTSNLAARTRRATQRLHATDAVLVGRISSTVADQLRTLGLTVSRVANTSSRFGAAAALATKVGGHHAFLVPSTARDSSGWQLPLATAGYAAFRHDPLLYSGHSSLTTPTARAIRRLGITRVTVVGDDTTVRPRLLRQLGHLGVAVTRVRSSNRYIVSAAFADRARAAGAHVGHAVVASGVHWTQAVATPALAAYLGQVSLLVDNRSLSRSRATAGWLAQHRRGIRTARLVGGLVAARPRVEAQLERRV